MVAVIRATQSPLNATRWYVELACGHEMWITSTRRPKKVAVCMKPHDAAKKGAGR